MDGAAKSTPIFFFELNSTLRINSVPVQQDEFFKAASEYARKLGLPRIYISSNSGARIGLVEELKPKFKVKLILKRFVITLVTTRNVLSVTLSTTWWRRLLLVF